VFGRRTSESRRCVTNVSCSGLAGVADTDGHDGCAIRSRHDEGLADLAIETMGRQCGSRQADTAGNRAGRGDGDADGTGRTR